MVAEAAVPRPALQGMPLYALVDPYTGDYPQHGVNLAQATSFNAIRAVREDAWGRPIHLAEGDDPVAYVYELPYLVDLEGADDASIDKLTEAALSEYRAVLGGDISHGCRIGTLIETWMTPADLMRRLQKMWAYRQNMHDFHYLHIADRRVFEALMHVFEPEALARWLGPIARWHILGRDARWRCIEGDAEQWYVDSGLGWRRSVDASRTLEGASLKVTGPQHLRLFDLEAVSRALRDWQRAGRALDADVWQRAWAGARAAASHGLDDPADRAAFAFCWMRDPDCADHAPVSHALQRSTQEDRPFAEVLAEMKYDIDHPDEISG